MAKNRRGHLNPNWRGGRSIDADGYVWIYAPDHPCAHEGKYLEHRMVVEESIGRRLSSNEHVHHLNGVRDDNRVENLVVLSRSDHAIEHGLGSRSKGRKMSQETKDKIAKAHLGKPKASRGRKKTGADLEASRRNILIAKAHLRRTPHQ